MATIIRRNQRRKTVKNNPTITIEEENKPNIPCEIIESILSRLPVKSLLRFKSVSKPWYSLISDAKFARFHLHQSNRSDCKTIFLRFGYPGPMKHHFLKFTNQNYQLEALEFPLKKYREARVLCSCDGLVLLKNTNSKMCVLWNPATRTYTRFSCPYPFTFAKAYGLCYDASSDDYKLVVEISSSCYAIFSYRNNSWTEKYIYSLDGISGPGLFVNGALHWTANESLKGSDSNAIEGELWQQLNSKICTECRHHYVNFPVYEKCGLHNTCEIFCFDPVNDRFKKLSKPACFDISYRFKLTKLEGQLCLYRNTYDLTMIETWMMKEYGTCNSWTKYLTIENLYVPHYCYHVRLLCSTNESNVVVDIHGSGVFLYNHKQNKLSEIDVFGDEYLNRIHMTIVTPLFCWNDSLILPTKINRTKKKQHGKKNFM